LANRFQKGLGGAAQGYAIGGPIGGIVGGLGGLIFGGNDKTPELPELQFSPESLRSYNFSDVNLEQINPEIYKRLMENDAVLQGMRESLASRRQGATANEQRQLSDYLNQQGSAMAGGGLVGTPMGNAMMADAAARMQAQMQDRAFQEYMQMQGNVQNAAQQGFQNYSGAQGNVLDQLQRNKQSSLGMDQLRNQHAMQQYGADQQALADSNAMWGGMLSGGLTGIANQNMMGSGPLFGDLGLGKVKSYFQSPSPPPAYGSIANQGMYRTGVEPMGPGGMGFGNGMYR
jgi:hypothetical protein